MSCEQYIRDATKNVKEELKSERWRFNKKLSYTRYLSQQPFPTLSYRPELDNSIVCLDSKATYYQILIRVFRWIVELGRININYEVAILSQYLANPRQGHLHQALHVFIYLDIYKEIFLRFDLTYLDVKSPLNSEENPKCRTKKMKEFYPDEEEAISSNAPEPRGKGFRSTVLLTQIMLGILLRGDLKLEFLST